jgi:hypothetical protein
MRNRKTAIKRIVARTRPECRTFLARGRAHCLHIPTRGRAENVRRCVEVSLDLVATVIGPYCTITIKSSNFLMMTERFTSLFDVGALSEVIRHSIGYPVKFK